MMRYALVLCVVFIMAMVNCSEDNATAPEGNGGTVEYGGLGVMVLRDAAPVYRACVVASLVGSTDKFIATTSIGGTCLFSVIPSGSYNVVAVISSDGSCIYGEYSMASVPENGSEDIVIDLDEEMDDLFPMALDNFWVFDGSDTIFVGPVKDINGVETYEVGPRDPDTHPGYHTHGLTAIYQHGYETPSGEDHIIDPPTVWIDLAASVGECWTIQDWGEGCLVSKSETVQTPLEEYSGCWKYEFKPEGAVDYYYMWFKEGVGLVRLDMGGETSLLTEYHLF